MMGFDFTFKHQNDGEEEIKVCVVNVLEHKGELEYNYYITDINDNELKDYPIDSYLEDDIFDEVRKQLRILKEEENLIDYERRCLNV